MLMTWRGGACGMRLLVTLVLLTSSARAVRGAGGAPRCHHPRCQHLPDVENHKYYDVEGYTIGIRNVKNEELWIECDGSNVLGSHALPRFEVVQPVSQLKLFDCPPPATSSLQDTFTVLNVSFCEQFSWDNPCELELLGISSALVIPSKWFAGLDQLQILKIRASSHVEHDFLMSLKSLRKLDIVDVILPVDLDAPPPSLQEFSLSNSEMKRLPEAIYTSANLEKITVFSYIPLDAVAVPPALHDLNMRSPATTLRLDVAPALTMLELHNWVELLPPPIHKCGVLRKIYLGAPAMHALPVGWLRNCSRLEQLIIKDAKNLTALPSKLFRPKSLLRNLVFEAGALETLPAGLLNDIEDLKTINLKNNNLKMFPRNFFGMFRYKLSEVYLAWNDLDGTALNELGQMPWYNELTVLDLSHNPRIGDVCDADGISPLRSLTRLRKMDLSNTGVTRICLDWRKAMTQLEQFELVATNVSELSYEDLQFTRVVQTEVLLRLAPITAVRVTREDFNDAKLAPPSFVSLITSVHFKCDCTVYWLRRALEHPRAQLALPDMSELYCISGGFLLDVPPEELVCEAQDKCAAAALPAGCECDSRPDDDSEQDHWIVRARWENSSLEIVPRRMYPFYPLYHSNTQGEYLTKYIS